jgi:hypothetical protein
MSTSTRKNDVSRFLVPNGGLYTQTVSDQGHGSRASSSLRPSHQIPPMDRGELNAFMVSSRGTANLIAPKASSTLPPIGEQPAPPAHLKGLSDVWETSLYGRAPQVATFDPKKFMAENDEKKVCIVRFLPERFERGRVQRPELVEEYINPATLHDDGARLMHPHTRRQIHEQEVNGRQGEHHLRECLREKSKIYRTCLHNYPHGALGLKDSPYTDNATAYSNAATLAAQSRAAMRRSKAGTTPASTIGEVLQHK